MKSVMILGVLFVLGTQPMLVISSLIFTVLVYSLYMLWVSSSFWFSYMIILVLMSGVLVVFMYMMSVLPNESFEVSSLVMVMLSVMMFYKHSSWEEFILEMSSGGMKIWSGITMVVSGFLVLYLLMVMVMIVWVGMLEKGAIRIS